MTTAEDTAVAITLAATDIDTPTTSLSFSIVSSPSDGTLTGGGANWTYRPAPNVNGVRSFTFKAFDGSLFSAPATVTITITPVNDPPVAVDDFVMTDAATPITVDVTGNDSDVDGDPVAIDSAAAPAHGSVEIVVGKLLYTPDASFTGTDVFAYTIVDPLGAAATAHVHVGVGVVRAPGLHEKYRLHHHSIREQITLMVGAAALREYHGELARTLAAWPAPAGTMTRRYALRHALTHRAEAGD